MTATATVPLINLRECDSFDRHADNPHAACGTEKAFVMIQPYDLHRFADTVRRMRLAITAACEIIETGDQRLLAMDGPAGNQPPDISLAEWRLMYVALSQFKQDA